MRMAGSPALVIRRDWTRVYCWEIFPKIQPVHFGQKSPISPVASGAPAGTMRGVVEGVTRMLSRNEALVALELRALNRACWLRREMLEGLADVNHQCLGLLAEQALALAPQGQPVLRQVGELWRALDERSRWQA